MATHARRRENAKPQGPSVHPPQQRRTICFQPSGNRGAGDAARCRSSQDICLLLPATWLVRFKMAGGDFIPPPAAGRFLTWLPQPEKAELFSSPPRQTTGGAARPAPPHVTGPATEGAAATTNGARIKFPSGRAHVSFPGTPHLRHKGFEILQSCERDSYATLARAPKPRLLFVPSAVEENPARSGYGGAPGTRFHPGGSAGTPVGSSHRSPHKFEGSRSGAGSRARANDVLRTRPL